MNHSPNTMVVLLPGYGVGWHTYNHPLACNHNVQCSTDSVCVLHPGCQITVQIHVVPIQRLSFYRAQWLVDILVTRELQLCYKLIIGGKFRMGHKCVINWWTNVGQFNMAACIISHVLHYVWFKFAKNQDNLYLILIHFECWSVFLFIISPTF